MKFISGSLFTPIILSCVKGVRTMDQVVNKECGNVNLNTERISRQDCDSNLKYEVRSELWKYNSGYLTVNGQKMCFIPVGLAC